VSSSPSVSFRSVRLPVCSERSKKIFTTKNSVVSDYGELVTELTLIILASAELKPECDRQLVHETEYGKKLQHDGCVKV
jgi:hypothetical protein